MARFFAALLIVALAISTSDAADANHQEQNFLTCGHHLTITQCDTYAKDNGFATGVSTATDATDKPYGCYKIPQDDSNDTPLSFVFNSNVAAKTEACTAATPCICDKLVGAFDTSTVTCHTDGFEPVFTYNPNSQTQDVTIDFTLGDGQTDGNDDANCKASVTGTNDQNTQATKSSFDSSLTSAGSKLTYGTLALPQCNGAFAHWTDDKGNADANDDVDYIRYLLDAEAIVTRKFRTGKIQRKRKFTFKIECLLERAVSASSTESFTVATALINANEQETAKDEFDFSAAIKFYDDDTYSGSAKPGAFAVNNNAKVFVQVEKGANQDLFVFSVQKCYATKDVSGDLKAYIDGNGLVDDFFVDECPADETVDFSTDSGNFRFEIQAFSFTGDTNAVFIHCDLLVCLANDATECAQKLPSDCAAPANNRRRRDITYKSLMTGSRKETITSTQAILLEGSQFHAPRCGNGFVYDRVSQECSSRNTFEASGIRLRSDQFKPDYYNTSSKAFKDMAREKEYLFWVLIKATGQDEAIRGVQVVRAHPGSLVLDVAVTHADTVTPKQAFEIFTEEVLKASPSTTRVQNILKITDEKVQYVPVVRQSEKADNEKLILIVVVVVLFVVVFIAGVTLFKVKQVRQARPATGFENKGVDA